MTDTYSIKFTSDGETSGKPAISIAPTAVDNSTSITIHGKYSTPFGEDLWTSILHVMENFCSTTGPSSTKVTMGQLWFDSGTQTLKIWRVLSVSPYTVGWAPVNSFDSSGTLTVVLKTSVVDNGILDDSATYDGYFTTKSYSDAHYLPRGNYVSGTTALSKAKIKYSTEVTFDTGDTTALVTKKYVDDKIGVVGSLSITVDADGKMTATKAFLGSPNNFILNDTPAFDDYFVTRDYADERYFLVGTFDNSVRRQSRSKIQYSSDVIYATNTDDDYTLVHKKHVADAIAAAGSGSSITVPAGGLVLSDGTALNNFAYTTANSGKFLSVTQAGALSWANTGLPTWLTGTITEGVLVSDGSTVTSTIGTGGQVLKTVDVGGVLSIEWGGAGLPSWFPQTVPSKGVLVSSGTAVTSSFGTADTVLTVDSSNNIQWIAKSSLGGGGASLPSSKGVLYVNNAGAADVVSSESADTVLSIDGTGAYKWLAKSSLGGSGSGPTATKLSVYGTVVSVPASRTTLPTTPSSTITLPIPSTTNAIDYEIRFGGRLTTTGTLSTGLASPRVRYIVKANGTTVYDVATGGIGGYTIKNSEPVDDLHTFKYAVPANTTQTLSVEIYAYCYTLQGGFPNGYDISQWLIADPLSATVTISGGGSSIAAPTAGVVTSTGTALTSTAYGTNNHLLASSGSGLKWVDPATIGGSGGVTTNVVNGAVYSTGKIANPTSVTLTIPIQSTTDTVQVVVSYGGHYGSSSTYTGSTILQSEFILKRGNIVIDSGFGGNVSGSESYFNGDFNRECNFSMVPNTTAPLTLTVKDGSFVDGYIIATVYSGTVGGGGSSGAVQMVRNTVLTKTNTSLSNIVSITIPASTDGTPVEYWVTGGTGSASTTPQNWSIATLTIKNGTSVITEGNINSSGSGWSGAGSVTVSTTSVTIIMAGTGAGSIIYRNNYLTATPITPIV